MHVGFIPRHHASVVRIWDCKGGEGGLIVHIVMEGERGREKNVERLRSFIGLVHSFIHLTRYPVGFLMTVELYRMLCLNQSSLAWFVAAMW